MREFGRGHVGYLDLSPVELMRRARRADGVIGGLAIGGSRAALRRSVGVAKKG